jgi:hypothetical protein
MRASFLRSLLSEGELLSFFTFLVLVSAFPEKNFGSGLLGVDTTHS